MRFEFKSRDPSVCHSIVVNILWHYHRNLSVTSIMLSTDSYEWCEYRFSHKKEQKNDERKIVISYTQETYLAQSLIKGVLNTSDNFSELVHSWLLEDNKFHITSIPFFPVANSLTETKKGTKKKNQEVFSYDIVDKIWINKHLNSFKSCTLVRDEISLVLTWLPPRVHVLLLVLASFHWKWNQISQLLPTSTKAIACNLVSD